MGGGPPVEQPSFLLHLNVFQSSPCAWFYEFQYQQTWNGKMWCCIKLQMYHFLCFSKPGLEYRLEFTCVMGAGHENMYYLT